MLMRCSAVLAVGALCAARALSAATVQQVRKTLPLRAGGPVEVTTDRAKVKIVSWDRAEVGVEAEIEARPESRNPEESLKRVRIDVEPSGDGGVRVVQRSVSDAWPDSWREDNPRPEVRIEVRVPRAVALRLQDDRSEVEIADLDGKLSLLLDRSHVRMAALTGTLTVEADRGELEIGKLALREESRMRLDRTEVRVGMATGRGATLDVDMDRGDLSMDPSLGSANDIERSRRRLSFRGPVGGGGPVLRVTADRASVRLSRPL